MSKKIFPFWARCESSSLKGVCHGAFRFDGFRVVCDPTFIAEQAARGASCGRSPSAERDFLAPADGRALGGYPAVAQTPCLNLDSMLILFNAVGGLNY